MKAAAVNPQREAVPDQAELEYQPGQMGTGGRWSRTRTHAEANYGTERGVCSRLTVK